MESSTIERTETVADVQKPGIVARVRNRFAAVFAFMAAMVSVPGAAFAQTDAPSDPLAGGGDGIFTQLTSYLQTHLVPAVMALAVVSIAIGLVLRWVRKAVHA